MFYIIGLTLLYIMFTCSGLTLPSDFVRDFPIVDKNGHVLPTPETDVEWSPEDESDLNGELGEYKRHTMKLYNFDDTVEPKIGPALSLAVRALNKSNVDSEMDSEPERKAQKNFDRYAETKNSNDTLEGLRDFEKRYDCSRGCHFKKPDIVFRIKALPTRCEKKKVHSSTGSPFSYKSACVVHGFNESEIEDEIGKLPVDIIHQPKISAHSKSYPSLADIYRTGDSKAEFDNQSEDYPEGKPAKMKYKDDQASPYMYQFMNDSHLKLA